MNEHNIFMSSENQKYLQKNIEHLKQITVILRKLGYWILSITSFNVITTLIYSLIVKNNFHKLVEVNLFLLKVKIPLITIFLLLIALICIGLLVFYNKKRIEGDYLFGNISDKLQSLNLSQGTSEIQRSEQQEYTISKYREIMRNFAQREDLPLTSGKIGITIYAGINLFFAIYLTVIENLIQNICF